MSRMHFVSYAKPSVLSALALLLLGLSAGADERTSGAETRPLPRKERADSPPSTLSPIPGDTGTPPLRRPRDVKGEAITTDNLYATNSLVVGASASNPNLYASTQLFAHGSYASTLVLVDTRPLAAGVGGQVQFGGTYTAAGAIERFSSVTGSKENAVDGNYDGVLQFWVRKGTYNEAMRIDSMGRVGIGTETPAQRLHVVGNVHATGTITGANITAHFQDVAEWVPATENFPAATVVVLLKSARNTVSASLSAYDTAVAGVVSAQPGITLGVPGPGMVQVATTGRVKVRVDANRGPIEVGDLLVTSDKPGTAMRSEPIAIGGRNFHQPGTIIGKALEPLPAGTGEILVLLSLQ